MFKLMAHMIKKHLSTMAHMSPEEFAEYEAAIVFDAKDSDTDGEIVEVVIKEVATNYWVCTCGAENKGKFCPECGKAKPIVTVSFLKVNHTLSLTAIVFLCKI